jgi:hypothetical protein
VSAAAAAVAVAVVEKAWAVTVAAAPAVAAGFGSVAGCCVAAEGVAAAVVAIGVLAGFH